MALSPYCDQAPPIWSGKYADGYLVQINDVTKTIFRYAIPFEDEKDAVLKANYSLTSDERYRYYQSLVQGIQRNKNISGLLRANHVPSILSCELVEQERDPRSGCNRIYVLTEEVRPIQMVLFENEINILTLLDVFIRLQIIVRDIAKTPHCVTHRGISLDEVYINAEGKILLGGFYYAASPSVPGITPYLPDHPQYFPSGLQQGAIGNAGTDMQRLAIILYNILSGLPWDTQWPSIPKVAPAYAPKELAEILFFGLRCTESDCNYFRRCLLNFRKDISKTQLSSLTIPICKPIRKEFAFK